MRVALAVISVIVLAIHGVVFYNQLHARWQEHQIQYFKYDLRQGAFVPGRQKGEPFYIGIFRHVPGPVLNLIGSLLYKHIG